MLPQVQKKVYWEKQGQDKLCGVHCINSLLQGPYFNEITLSEIALELDSTEKQLMAGQGFESKDFLKFMEQESNNVADDGNYSFQVLAEALRRKFNLEMESVDSKINRSEDLSIENGFVCNSSSHWFGIRKIEGIWLNLNSTNRNGPEIVSDFYLSAFLLSIKENGYSIFVVRGEFPEYIFNPNELSKKQILFTMEEVKKTHEMNMKSKNYKLNIGGTDERDLEEAIKNSLKDYDHPNKNKPEPINEESEDKQKEEPKKFFSGKGVIFENNSIKATDIKGYDKYLIDPNYDPELYFSILDYITTKFSQEFIGENSIQINFKFPNGKSQIRKFDKKSNIEDLYDFCKFVIMNEQNYEFYLSSSYPSKKYLDLNLSLEKEGLNEDITVIINSII